MSLLFHRFTILHPATRLWLLMRYDNWDAILFPRDSHIPIQEFRTACYVTYDEYGRQLPTLTCYIASLPPAAPFRISIHSWAVKTMPTAVIESRRKPNQRVVYTVSVIVDGTRVFHDIYSLSCKWPQEIVNEKRSIAGPSQQSSQRRPPLEFPPFRHNVLMQNCWDPRENSGRIRVLLSEQLVGQSEGSTDLEYGATNDIVCFLFQHAPRDILEQAGIAWPIRNPLYLPSVMSDAHAPLAQPPPSCRMSYGSVPEGSTKATASKKFSSPFQRPPNPEPGSRPNTAPVPDISQFPKPPGHDRGRTRDQGWEEFIADSVEGSSVEESTNWSTLRAISKPATDSMPECNNASPHLSAQKGTRQSQRKIEQAKRKRGRNEPQGKTDDERRHVYVTFREDQLGRLVEAFSPPKPIHNPHVQHGHSQCPHRGVPHPSPVFPPHKEKVQVPANLRPSPSALERRATRNDFINTAYTSHVKGHARGKGSMTGLICADDESDTRNVSEIRGHGSYPAGSHVSTTHPFVQRHLWESSNLTDDAWATDVDMRDAPTMFTNTARLQNSLQQPTSAGIHSPVPPPSAHGSIKSRKEGMRMESPAAVPETAPHDQGLVPTLDETTNSPSGEEAVMPRAPAPTPASFAQTDSTSAMAELERVESELFTALGEELNSFNKENASPLATAATDVDILPGLEDFNSPPAKRRRPDVFGGESESGRCREPLAETRMDRGNLQAPQMRGG
ncbi:uncharacterized protein EI97DRAFT_489528 [Westerdykella ornata]|uniref:Uncharacterized protein n=1 Tax=Westerdykella ornata TaxID=318751 RepID=A0A6A6JKG8_WESOR|nr:uncharacterized protein EI97DRAFT_489528 [Westerdykella ornata]KAF2276972.1 hypothetical protein EI97DRAFT_489528 [Westerdykella ornata]